MRTQTPNDDELSARSVAGFGETVAALARWGVGAEAEVRRRDALGGRIDAAGEHPWVNAAVVPPGFPPPADDPLLPFCLWTLADAAPGRVERPEVAMPCLGLTELPADGEGVAVGTPSLTVLGEVNDRAYEDEAGTLAPLIGALEDPRIRAHGLQDAGRFVCVAMSFRIGEDVSIQYVATAASHRRRGLAAGLLTGVLARAREEGMRTATLQASPDGLSVYERMGFRRLATLRAFVRPV